jgi:hypothetical protein
VFEAHPLDYLLKPFSDEFKVLSDGTELKLSRGYRHRLEEQLGQSLWCESGEVLFGRGSVAGRGAFQSFRGAHVEALPAEPAVPRNPAS